MKIKVYTDDGIIWHRDRLVKDITNAVSANIPIEFDTNTEGPDLTTVGLYDIVDTVIKDTDYPLSNITVSTANLYENYPGVNYKKEAPYIYCRFAQGVNLDAVPKDFTSDFKHIGYFVSRCNWHRLKIAGELYQNYSDKTLLTFHYDPISDYHQANLELSQLMHYEGADAVVTAANLLKAAPITLDEPEVYPIVHPRGYNLYSHYRKFFAEIVSETYLQGDTFFPTEKLWRPIMMLTPFIVQGPQRYIERLQKLGFRTFNHWWTEGHDEDPYNCHASAVCDIVDEISRYSVTELDKIYNEMLPNLVHNRNLMFSLTEKQMLELLSA